MSLFSTRSATSMVPEEYLLSQISPRWQNRFYKALQLLEQADPRDQSAINWEEIASQCAISPYHFHRMFRLVFHEAPGQYVQRKRLQWASLMLVERKELSVSHIAHQIGFSTSQALTKALKKATGCSARDIRNRSGDYEFVQTLVYALAQPAGADKNLEQQLAQQIPFEVMQLPERQIISLVAAPATLHSVQKAWKQLRPVVGVRMINVAAMTNNNSPDEDSFIRVGYVTTDSNKSNFRIAASSYLCGRVIVDSEAAYIAAWDALFEYAIKQGIELSEQGFEVEEILNPETLLVEATDLVISVPVMSGTDHQ